MNATRTLKSDSRAHLVLYDRLRQHLTTLRALAELLAAADGTRLAPETVPTVAALLHDEVERASAALTEWQQTTGVGEG